MGRKGKTPHVANKFFFLFASIIFRACHFFFFFFYKKAKILHESDVQTKVFVPQKLMLDQISVCYCQRRLMFRGLSKWSHESAARCLDLCCSVVSREWTHPACVFFPCSSSGLQLCGDWGGGRAAPQRRGLATGWRPERDPGATSNGFCPRVSLQTSASVQRGESPLAGSDSCCLLRLSGTYKSLHIKAFYSLLTKTSRSQLCCVTIAKWKQICGCKQSVGWA